MARELTTKQQAFLDALFGPCNGDIRTAMDVAGYAESASQNLLVKTLKEEIIERSMAVLAGTAPKAAMSFKNIIDDPTQLGAKEVMLAAKEVLDRTGLVKVERVDATINSPNGLILLPPKRPTEVTDGVSE